MNYDELITFIKVCEIQNFTKTAEQLSMSQPTVSLHIKNLENEFQTQLLQRSTKLLKITPTGEIVLERVKQIVQIVEQIKQDIAEHHEAIQGELKIGASFTIGEYILPPLLAQLKQQYPNLSFQITIGNTNEIVQAVKLLQVDIGLIEGATDDKELIVAPFMTDELVVVASIEHPLAVQQNVLMQDLQGQDWISREVGSGTRDYLNHFFRSNGIKVASILTISSNQGVKETVIHNLGLSLLSKNIITKELEIGKICILSLNSRPLTRTFSYLSSPMMNKKGTTNLFIQMLEQLEK